MIFLPGFVSYVSPEACFILREAEGKLHGHRGACFKTNSAILKGVRTKISYKWLSIWGPVERGTEQEVENTKIHALESIFCFVLFLFLLAEEQLSKACPCGKCSSFDCENPPQDDISSQSRDKRQEGCVLLSSWLTEEIKAVTSFQALKRPPGVTEFTYSSPKVS